MPNRQASGSCWGARLMIWVVPLLVMISCATAGAGAAPSGIAGAPAADRDGTLHMIALRVPSEEQRQKALARLQDAIARQETWPGPLDTSVLKLRRESAAVAPGFRSSTEIDRCYAIYLLRHLAVSLDYGPAIRDLLRFSANPSLLVLMPEEEYYFLARAMHRGFDVTDLKARYADRGAALPAALRKRLDAAARRLGGGDGVLPLWSCAVALQSYIRSKKAPEH